MMIIVLPWLALLRVLELMLQLHVLHENISTWSLLCIPSCVEEFDVMVMMYTCSYSEYIFIRKVVGVFSRKGFPGVNHGVYYACLFM